MSEVEIRDFVEEFARVRLTHILRRLDELEAGQMDAEPLVSESSTDWTDPSLLAESGVDPSWIAALHDPGTVYLHIDTAVDGNWPLVARYVAFALLSGKQARVILPLLKGKRRPKKTSTGHPVTRELLAEEVQRLNRILRWAATSTVDWNLFRRYQSHVRIHGGSQNALAIVGATGAALAVTEALEEIAPGRIIDVLGARLPSETRTPVQIHAHALARTGIAEGPLRALLLDNGRAVVFAEVYP